MRRFIALRRIPALLDTSIPALYEQICLPLASSSSEVAGKITRSIFDIRGITSSMQRGFSSLPPHTALTMPALSPTMSTGNLLEWKVTEGQEITAGDLLAEVETDKATLGWENQDDGFVAKLLVPAGSKDIAVGEPVLILVEDADNIAAFKKYQPSSSSSSSSTAEAAAAAAASDSTATSSSVDAQQQASFTVSDRLGPAARMLLQKSGLSLESVQPTGPNGIVTKGDVLTAIANPPAAKQPQQQEQPKAAASKPATTTGAAQQQQQPPTTTTATTDAYTDIPTTQIRRIIASRLLESKTTIPHLYIQADVELDNINSMRDALKQQGTKVSVNDFVIKAVAMALKDVPKANTMWDTTNEVVASQPSIDISIAVATEGGLITPIVKNADTKSLTQISAEVRELAGRARANKLKPEEFIGGSFSISNLGMFGVDSFYAIINPPQACIMAVGTGRKVARLPGGGGSGSTSPVVASVMTVTLSADNRVYDGEIASDFLQAFAGYMANPLRLVQV